MFIHRQVQRPCFGKERRTVSFACRKSQAHKCHGLMRAQLRCATSGAAEESAEQAFLTTLLAFLQGAVASQEKDSHKTCLQMCTTEKCKSSCGQAKVSSAKAKVGSIVSTHVAHSTILSVSAFVKHAQKPLWTILTAPQDTELCCLKGVFCCGKIGCVLQTKLINVDSFGEDASFCIGIVWRCRLCNDWSSDLLGSLCDLVGAKRFDQPEEMRSWAIHQCEDLMFCRGRLGSA